MVSAIQEDVDDAMISNPRYPHWCRIIRKTVEDPMEDEEDFTPLPDYDNVHESHGDYDPLGMDMCLCNDGQPSEETESWEEETTSDTQTIVVYEGECRSYEKNTTSDKGDVITSYRGLALPLNQDAWNKLGIVPMEGDEIVVVHGVFREYGRVIDKNVSAASFAGTHLVWRYGRN